MTIVPVMWIVWSALAVLAIALFLYRSSLMKDEEDPNLSRRLVQQ